MTQVFIKVQSSVGQSWADAAESTNSYITELSDDPLQTLYNEKEYEQKINAYTQVSNLIKLVKNDKNFTISTAVPRENGNKLVDMSKAFETLTAGNGSFGAVHFGYIFDSSRVKDTDVIDNSIFFARDPDSNKFVNAETLDEISDESIIEAAIFFTIYRIRGTSIYYMVINPNLIAVPEDLSGDYDDIEYFHINSRDGNFKSRVFRPSITGGTLVGDNIIVATEDKVTIDTFGLSALHFKSKRVSQDNLPAKINMTVKSSFPQTREGSVITLDLSGKSVGTLSYQWVTGTYLDSCLTGNESLKYNFAIIKE